MTHEWAIGDWCEHNEQRKFIYDVNDKAIHYVTHGGNTDYFYPSTLGVKHLPDCTGWDWQPPKPIEPPEGYRLLTEGEIVLKDDMFFFEDKYWDEVMPEARKSIGEPWSSSRNVPFARKIEPKYRPFANAAEFAPHRDKWMKFKDGVNGRSRVVGYNDDGVWGKSLCDYESAFSVYVFEDGTPFGIEA